MSNKFDSKMSGIVGIGTIQLITGLVIQFSGEFIQHSLQEVAQISVNSQISSFVPVNPEVRAAFGIGLILLWVNLHLTVEGFNIDSLGDSKVENGLFILVSVLLVVL